MHVEHAARRNSRVSSFGRSRGCEGATARSVRPTRRQSSAADDGEGRAENVAGGVPRRCRRRAGTSTPRVRERALRTRTRVDADDLSEAGAARAPLQCVPPPSATKSVPVAAAATRSRRFAAKLDGLRGRVRGRARSAEAVAASSVAAAAASAALAAAADARRPPRVGRLGRSTRSCCRVGKPSSAARRDLRRSIASELGEHRGAASCAARAGDPPRRRRPRSGKGSPPARGANAAASTPLASKEARAEALAFASERDAEGRGDRSPGIRRRWHVPGRSLTARRIERVTDA